MKKNRARCLFLKLLRGKLAKGESKPKLSLQSMPSKKGHFEWEKQGSKVPETATAFGLPWRLSNAACKAAKVTRLAALLTGWDDSFSPHVDRGYRGTSKHIPYEELVHPITMSTCAAQ